MADGPRPLRPLPSSPAPESERGLTTGLVTRIVIVCTIVLGQLWALTVALEASLLEEDGLPWLLAGFSILSFVVTLFLTNVEPPRRGSDLRGRAATGAGRYVSRPADDGSTR